MVVSITGPYNYQGTILSDLVLGVKLQVFLFSADLPEALVSKTGIEKGVKRVSVFDEMRVKLKPQSIINGNHNDSNRKSF